MNIDNYYEEKGNGSPIVFIHGSYATTSTWKKMIEKLSVNHHCISIKLPGHGGTPDPEDFDDPSIETELTILEQVVLSLTDQPIHLVGHSYGGVIALAEAIKGNLNISQVTLFEPVAVSVLDEEMSAVVQRFLGKYRQDVSNKVPFSCGQVIDFWGGEGSFATLPVFIKEGMEGLVSNNLRHWDTVSGVNWEYADLHNISVPTRIISGTKSNSVAHAICDILNNQIPNSKKYTIEGASHFLVTTHANECIAVLNDQSMSSPPSF